MSTELDRLNSWKNKVAQEKQNLANLQGQLSQLHQRAGELKEGMKTDFGAKSLPDLEKKIETQKAKVAGMVTELEGVFGEAA